MEFSSLHADIDFSNGDEDKNTEKMRNKGRALLSILDETPNPRPAFRGILPSHSRCFDQEARSKYGETKQQRFRELVHWQGCR